MYITQEQIYAATNNGLDVILKYYPDAQKAVTKTGAKFKIRGNEKTASASLFKAADGAWLVTDFGGDQKPRNAIAVVMHEENCDFKEAILLISRDFNIDDTSTYVPASFQPAKQTRDATDEELEGTWHFDIKESFSESDIKEIFVESTWQDWKDVAAEGEKICKRYKLFSLTSYTIIKNRKATTISSTDTYPIYMFDQGTWKKIYQPRSADPAYRFMHYGKRDKDFIFGYSQCLKAYNDLNPMEDDDYEKDKADVQAEKRKEKKLPEIILCTGGSDALNVAALGFEVVWLNSETQKLPGHRFAEIKKLCTHLYNLPDIDATGTREAHNLALYYMDLRTIRLPETLAEKKDKRGKPCKDVRDFLRHFSKKEFKDLVDPEVSLPYQFWNEKWEKDKVGNWKAGYEVNNACMYNFLHQMGFNRYKVNEDLDYYIKLDGNIVTKVKPDEIKQFINDFLREKKKPLELRNCVYRTNQLNEQSLKQLSFINLDFTDYTKEDQYIFFKNKTLQVTKEKITEHRPGEIKKFVWNDEVIQHRFELLPDFFTVTNEGDQWGIRLN